MSAKGFVIQLSPELVFWGVMIYISMGSKCHPLLSNHQPRAARNEH